MVDTLIRESRETEHKDDGKPDRCLGITKADVERFLFGKHLTACPVCGRFRSKCDVDIQTLPCERAETASCDTHEPLNILMIVCQHCGAIQFHDRTVIRHWLDCQHEGAPRK